MPDFGLEDVKRLRDMTGAGMMDCRNALQEANGDIDLAIQILREKGIAKAAKKVGRETANGLVEAYLHKTGDFPPQTGAMVEVNCETDFVAKGEDFRKLARELALHIAAAKPRWVTRDEVPEDLVETERAVYRRRAEEEGKPEAAIARIVEGQIEKFYEENCLLDQPYIRDPRVPIRDLIAEAIGKLQENISVRRFARFNIKEA